MFYFWFLSATPPKQFYNHPDIMTENYDELYKGTPSYTDSDSRRRRKRRQDPHRLPIHQKRDRTLQEHGSYSRRGVQFKNGDSGR